MYKRQDLNGDAATASARRLSEEGYDVVGYGGDVTDVARVEEIVADFATRGTVDVLVAAAGIFPVVEFSQVTMELWRKAVSYTHLRLLVRAVLYGRRDW